MRWIWALALLVAAPAFGQSTLTIPPITEGAQTAAEFQTRYDAIKTWSNAIDGDGNDQCDDADSADQLVDGAQDCGADVVSGWSASGTATCVSAGAGDMTKAVYDTGDNARADEADDLICASAPCVSDAEVSDIALGTGTSGDYVSGTTGNEAGSGIIQTGTEGATFELMTSGQIASGVMVRDVSDTSWDYTRLYNDITFYVADASDYQANRPASECHRSPRTVIVDSLWCRTAIGTNQAVNVERRSNPPTSTGDDICSSDITGTGSWIECASLQNTIITAGQSLCLAFPPGPAASTVTCTLEYYDR